MGEPAQGLGDRLGVLARGDGLLARRLAARVLAHVLGLEHGVGALPRHVVEGVHRPGLGRLEGADFELAIDHDPQGHRLDAPGREVGLVRQAVAHDGAHLVADQPVQDAPRLLGVDQVHVEGTHLGERALEALAGDLVELEPLDLLGR
ncbi:hypothetical protein D3C86_1407910 [compost metagenome]